MSYSSPSCPAESKYKSEAARISLKAGHKTTWEKLKKYKFSRAAVWCVPLKQQGAIVAQRVLIGIFSLGLSEIAFGPAGHCDHWAFVAEGINKENVEDRIYFVAQFYDGYIIPSITTLQDVFQGEVLPHIRGVLYAINSEESNLRCWVVRPRVSA